MTASDFKLRTRKSKVRKTAIVVGSLWTLLTVDPAAAAAVRPEPPASDPFERVNRVMFYINGAFDFLLLRPAAIGYKRIMPRPIRTGLRNAISNLGEPGIAINDILQGHGKKAGRTVVRFVGNSTIGLLGLIDVATPVGLRHHNNDFGITLARYGVKSGPYIFLPILGPTTIRDGTGQLVGIALDPLTYARYTGSTEVAWTHVVAGGLDERAAADKNIKALMASATDVYASIRSYYLQNREAAITGGKLDIGTLPDFGDTPSDAGPQTAPPPQPTTSAEPLGPPPPENAPATDAPTTPAPTPQP
jgi:phospholipid-binding lipoprotein MlaA